MAHEKPYHLEKEQISSLRVWEPVEHKQVEYSESPIGQVEDPPKLSDGMTTASDQEGTAQTGSSGEENAGTTSEEESSSTTDGDGLSKHRLENVTAMTPDEYLRYKRGIKEDIYGPAGKRESGVVGLHNMAAPENATDITEVDPSKVTYDQLHSQDLLSIDVEKLEDQLEGLEELVGGTTTSDSEVNSE